MQDKDVYLALYTALYNKFVRNNKSLQQKTELEILDQICQDFRNLLLAQDTLQQGAIKSSQLMEVLRTEFINDLSENLCSYILRIAQNISMLPNQQGYQDPEIKYTFFCVNIHKYLFMYKI